MLIRGFKNTIIILIGSYLLFLTGCKLESFGDPVTPSLALDEIAIVKHPDGRDSLITIKFKYTDGDGDIGLSDKDTFSPFRFGEPYFSNLWVDLEYLDSGKWVKASDDSLQLSQRIVNLTPNGDVKSIRGTIDINMPVKPTLFFTFKEIKLTFTLVDRGKNESNKVPTGIINLNY